MKKWEGSLNFGTVDQNQSKKPKEQADWLEFERKARVVETALRLYDNRPARRLWHELGLPEVPGIPRLLGFGSFPASIPCGGTYLRDFSLSV